MNFNDLVKQVNTPHTRETHVESECTVYKLTPDMVVQTRKRSAFALDMSKPENTDTTRMQVTEPISETIAETDTYRLIRYNVEGYESRFGKLKLNLLYGLELNAYIKYIKWIYAGDYMSPIGDIHRSGLYVFELNVPNMFGLQYIGVDLFCTKYYKYENEDMMLEHLVSYCKW